MKEKEWNEISENYYEEILSPIKNSLKSPLFYDIKQIKDKDKKSVIDLGCGLGELEKLLSKEFKEVVAIDFSEEMIKSAQEKNKALQNVEFQVKDISSMPEFHNKFDVAISINSIIVPDLNKIDQMFSEVNNTLKKDGKFICILPSMEIYAYQAMLIAQKQGKKIKDIEKLREKAKEFINDEEHDFLLGVTDFEGKQKYYYRFEILWRLKKAGFKNIEIKKVLYSWKEFAEAGQKNFPGEDPPWDWYVICEKS